MIMTVEIDIPDALAQAAVPILADKYGVKLDGVAPQNMVNVLSQAIADNLLSEVKINLANEAGNVARQAKLEELSDEPK